MWVALLNLENLYGSQESLMAVFQSALQQNEPLEVYRRLASVYLESNKISVCHLISLYYYRIALIFCGSLISRILRIWNRLKNLFN